MLCIALLTYPLQARKLHVNSHIVDQWWHIDHTRPGPVRRCHQLCDWTKSETGHCYGIHSTHFIEHASHSTRCSSCYKFYVTRFNNRPDDAFAITRQSTPLCSFTTTGLTTPSPLRVWQCHHNYGFDDAIAITRWSTLSHFSVQCRRHYQSTNINSDHYKLAELLELRTAH